MKRVTVVGQLPPPVHGSNVMAARLLEALALEGWESELVDKRFSGSIEDVGRFSVRKLLQAPHLWVRIARSDRAGRSPVVLFLTDRPGSFLVDAVSSLVVRAQGRPLVHYIHTQGFTRLALRGPVWRWLVRRVLSAASRIVSLSPALGADLSDLCDPERVRFIPNTVGDSDPPVRQAPDVPILLFLSNLFPSKRPHLVVEIVEQLRDSGLQVEAQIAGAAVDPEYFAFLKNKIDESSVEGYVRIVGALDEKAKREAYSRVTVLVHPTTDDAQPLVILEAMSAGLPTVASDIGGIRDILSNELLGHVTSGDASSFAAAIAVLIETDATKNFALRAAHYSDVYGPRAYGRAWNRTLDELMQRQADR